MRPSPSRQCFNVLDIFPIIVFHSRNRRNGYSIFPSLAFSKHFSWHTNLPASRYLSQHQMSRSHRQQHGLTRRHVRCGALCSLHSSSSRVTWHPQRILDARCSRTTHPDTAHQPEYLDRTAGISARAASCRCAGCRLPARQVGGRGGLSACDLWFKARGNMLRKREWNLGYFSGSRFA